MENGKWEVGPTGPGRARTRVVVVTFFLLFLGGALLVGGCPRGGTAVDPVAEGKKIFATHGCRTCHTIEGLGGSNGPNLTSVGKHYVDKLGEEKAAEFFGNHIRDPLAYPGDQKDKYRIGAKMPPFKGTDVERDHLVRYLLTLGREATVADE